jgi:hypothetical protein
MGYSAEDEAGHRCDFPDRVFQKDQIFALHTGSGSDSQTDLYRGRTGTAVWNNGGDTVKVLDPQGHIVLSKGY